MSNPIPTHKMRTGNDSSHAIGLRERDWLIGLLFNGLVESFGFITYIRTPMPVLVPVPEDDEMSRREIPQKYAAGGD